MYVLLTVFFNWFLKLIMPLNGTQYVINGTIFFLIEHVDKLWNFSDMGRDDS